MHTENLNEEERKELLREEFDQIWGTLGAHSIEIFENDFEKASRKLLQFLVSSLVLEENFGVFHYNRDNKQWARIEYDFYNNADKSLALLYDGKIIVLELFIYDDDSEENNNRFFYYNLTEEDLQFIPDSILTKLTGIKTKVNKISSAAKKKK